MTHLSCAQTVNTCNATWTTYLSITFFAQKGEGTHLTLSARAVSISLNGNILAKKLCSNTCPISKGTSDHYIISKGTYHQQGSNPLGEPPS